MDINYLATDFEPPTAIGLRRIVPQEDREFGQPTPAVTSTLPTQVGDILPEEEVFVKKIKAFDLLDELTSLKDSAVNSLSNLWDDLTSKQDKLKDLKIDPNQQDKIKEEVEETKSKIDDAENKVKDTESKIKDLKIELESKEKPDDTIKSFQAYLSSPQPVIGKLYNGPIDGISNPELVSAASNVEKIMATTLNINDPYGMLWNHSSNKFNTTVGDLSESLRLLSLNKNASRYADEIKKGARLKYLREISKY